MELFFMHSQEEPLAMAVKSKPEPQEIDLNTLIKQKSRQPQRLSTKFSFFLINYHSKANSLFEDPNLFQIFFERLQCGRFDDHRICAPLHDSCARFWLVIRCNNNHWNWHKPWFTTQISQDFQTIHSGHVDIEQNQPGSKATQQRYRRAGAISHARRHIQHS